MQVWSHLAPSMRAIFQREASHLDAVGWRASGGGAASQQHLVLDLACELGGGVRGEAGRGWARPGGVWAKE